MGEVIQLRPQQTEPEDPEAVLEDSPTLIALLEKQGLAGCFERAVVVTKAGAFEHGEHMAGYVDAGTHIVILHDGTVAIEDNVQKAAESAASFKPAAHR